MRLSALTTLGILAAAALFAAGPARAAWGHAGGAGFHGGFGGGWHGGFGGWHGGGFHGGWGGNGFRAGWGGFRGGWGGFGRWGYHGWGYHGWGWGYPGFRVGFGVPYEGYGYGIGYPVAPIYHSTIIAARPVIVTHAIHHVAYAVHHNCVCRG